MFLLCLRVNVSAMKDIFNYLDVCFVSCTFGAISNNLKNLHFLKYISNNCKVSEILIQVKANLFDYISLKNQTM